MSDVSRGPGWWIASDGRWYPPEQHPSRQAPVVPPALPVTAPAAQPAPAVGDPMALPSRPTPVARRNLVVWGLAVVVLLVAVLSLALVLGSSSSSTNALTTGTATGSITVTSPPSGQPTFEGSIDGKALSGSVSAPTSSGSSLSDVAFTYTGDFDGTSYSLDVKLDVARTRSSATSGSGLSVFLAVTGTYGSAPIKASVQLSEPSAARGSSASLPVSFHGTVGSQTLTGAAVAHETSDHTIDVSVRFAVH